MMGTKCKPHAECGSVPSVEYFPTTCPDDMITKGPMYLGAIEIHCPKCGTPPFPLEEATMKRPRVVRFVFLDSRTDEPSAAISRAREAAIWGWNLDYGLPEHERYEL